MINRIAVCPGSFDPVTLGHVDLVRRATALADEVVVAVGTGYGKNALLAPEQRRDLFAAAVADLPGVRVELMPGLLVDLCREVGARAVIKGIRGGADYDHEQPMALMNRHLAGIETVFLPADPTVAHISSTMVRDVARYGGPIADLVPAGVEDAVRAALADRKEQR
ncbi:pantetheine-phosphate adenylyltransferase [Pseudactinotalea sp. HY158]|uniref:pantetheine-phosphate adenylyltransferase n=1 Tax=unclassified Pseudactinotalea TaxID=2649176 RepID=UPI00129C6DEC|nr:pantetheine-phosphate adenylyltransferase [Pseudactinotalea sp. HY158]MPV51210.1 pantetheine-phosphate adenylyltransferase [Pseudactinotalea sp. HY160]QGH69008.1 pantetheine-phosphate adenylyltransferase [Pseudactinotalea sp. HY158]